jgi:hypothetical protein
MIEKGAIRRNMNHVAQWVTLYSSEPYRTQQEDTGFWQIPVTYVGQLRLCKPERWESCWAVSFLRVR